MKLARVAAIGAAMLLAGAQLVRPDRTNPRTDAADILEAQVRVPPEVRAILRRSCSDCHSHDTRWPWYSHVAPVSWFVIDHVNHGRRHLNLSRWPPTPPEGAEDPWSAICNETRAGAMPLRSYLLMHGAARLRPQDVDTLCRWAEASRRSPTSLP